MSARTTTSEDMRNAAIRRADAIAEEADRLWDRLQADLAACPFCAGAPTLCEEAETAKKAARWAVWCDDCTAQGPAFYYPEQAADAWNRRAGDAAACEERQRLAKIAGKLEQERQAIATAKAELRAAGRPMRTLPSIHPNQTPPCPHNQ